MSALSSLPPPAMPSSAAHPPPLPPEITVLERGWLSANSIVFRGRHETAVVDTGYCSHAQQTVALLQDSLGGRPLDQLLNTHLHSDHCGGNAALQQHWPQVHTAIPPGQAAQVRDWDPYALSYTPTGQNCPQFRFDSLLQPGTQRQLGDKAWQVHAAPGHDTHSIILFEPADRILIAADALWEKGFGVVFPELDGTEAFSEVAATLDVIERLEPLTVIPGHGAVFHDVASALAVARKRLDGFVRQPPKHALYAAKVLLKYKLLEWQKVPLADLSAWTEHTDYLRAVRVRYFPDQTAADWLQSLVADLVRSGAAVQDGTWLHNA